MDCDSSNYAIGSVLSQVQDGIPRVIAYGSRALTKTEKLYCSSRKEMLAVIYFLEYFRGYLLGNKFICNTDAIALKWLRANSKKESILGRWNLTLDTFGFKEDQDALSRIETLDFDINWRKGTKNKNCDGLSRRVNEEILVNQITNSTNNQEIPPLAEIIKIQQNDPEIKPIFQVLQKQITPKQNELQSETKFTRRMLAQIHKLRINEQGLLQYKYGESNDIPDSDPYKILVPYQLRETLMSHYHREFNSNHLGIEKCYEKLTSLFWWPAVKRDITEYIKSCEICPQYKQVQKNFIAPLHNFESSYFNEILHIDFLGPVNTSSSKFKYMLVMVDSFTNYLQVTPLKNITTETTVQALIDNWITKFGTPALIFSDCGSQLMSNIFQQVCKQFGIEHQTSTPYHKIANGRSEAAVKNIKKLIKMRIHNKNKLE